MLNPGVPKCDEDLITLEIYVEQGKTLNYKVFLYIPQCENIKSDWVHIGSHLHSHLY